MLMSVPTDFLPKLQGEKNIKVVTLPGEDLFYMPMNTAVAPFNDIKVREATAFAVNQKEILTSLFGGIGAEGHNFLISSLLEANIDPKLNISYDPARSKKALDEAGWVPGADGIRVKGGVPLKVKLWTQNGTEYKRVSEVIQAQLKVIGMQADITIFDAATINDQYRKKTEHQLAVRSYNWANADIIDWFFAAKRAGYPNISMLNEPKAEALNQAAMKGARTWDERVANFKAYHEYVMSQFLFAPIYQPVQNFKSIGFVGVCSSAWALDLGWCSWRLTRGDVVLELDFEPEPVLVDYASLPAAHARSLPTLEWAARNQTIDADRPFLGMEARCSPDYLIRVSVPGARYLLVGDASLASARHHGKKEEKTDAKPHVVERYRRTIGWSIEDQIVRCHPMGAFVVFPSPSEDWRDFEGLEGASDCTLLCPSPKGDLEARRRLMGLLSTVVTEFRHSFNGPLSKERP